MNLEEAVWYVAVTYAVVLVALLLLFALLARRLVRLTQRVNALRGGADQSKAGADGDGVSGVVEAAPDSGDVTGVDAVAAGASDGPGAGAAASAGRDVLAGYREGPDDRPSRED